MKPIFRIRALIAALALSTPLVVAACDEGITQADDEETAFLSVVPQGGATDVDPSMPVVIEFSHPMLAGMEAYADVHEGHAEGSLVAGNWSWNEDRTHMTFTPAAPLKPHTQYVVHIGGGMQDEDGHPIDYEEHRTHMGGEWMTQDMHQGGDHGTGGGMGGMGGTGMGTGWTHPTNGSYGMLFTFTTA